MHVSYKIQEALAILVVAYLIVKLIDLAFIGWAEIFSTIWSIL